jgi:hypothetical protein
MRARFPALLGKGDALPGAKEEALLEAALYAIKIYQSRKGDRRKWL